METNSSDSTPFPIPIVIIDNLDVPLIGQQTPMWCWAASTQMALDYIGITGVTQCAEANHEFNRTDCCNDPTPSECILGGHPQLPYWGAQADHTPPGTALSFVDIQSQIAGNMPIIFSWQWIPKGGHVMVVTGYMEVMYTQLLFINNPWPPNQGDQQLISYTDYVSNPTPPHAHNHGVDFYNLMKAADTQTKKQNITGAADPAPPVRYADQAAATAAGLQLAYILLKKGTSIPADISSAINDPSELSLGTPITVRGVDADLLGRYDGTSSPTQLWAKTDTLLYPVLHNGKIVSSVLLEPDAGQWKIACVGSMNGTTNIYEALKQVPAQATDTYVVHPAWLDRLYVIFEDAGNIQALHVYNDPQTGFRAGTIQPAAEVFGRLAPYAQNLENIWPKL